MFYGANLTAFSSDLSSLMYGVYMFYGANLESFSSDLSSLTNGYCMFYNCENLTSFSSDLSSLTNGSDMFYGCKLDTPSVQHIADTINTVTGNPSISIGVDEDDHNLKETYYQQIRDKGWDVFVLTN